jgi:hypothetical protein
MHWMSALHLENVLAEHAERTQNYRWWTPLRERRTPAAPSAGPVAVVRPGRTGSPARVPAARRPASGVTPAAARRDAA